MSEEAASLIEVLLSWTGFALDTEMMTLRRVTVLVGFTPCVVVFDGVS